METQVEIGGRKLTFSALNMGQIRALQLTLKSIREEKISGLEALLAFSPHIHASIRKVHQDISVEQLEELLTVHDLPAAQTALLEASGLRAVQGETKPAEK
jgi:hypothetical protein